MDMFNALFDDNMTISEMAILFVALLLALFVLFWLFRKIFGSASARTSKSRQPRLSVTDAAVVDDKRRLVLVRRDNVEHLVMIGGPSDIVVEQNIVRAAPVEIPAGRMASVTAPSPASSSAPSATPPTVAAREPSTPQPSVEPAPATPPVDNASGHAARSEAAGASILATGAGVAAAAQTTGSSLTGLARETADTAVSAVENAGEAVADTTAKVSDLASDNIASVTGTSDSNPQTPEVTDAEPVVSSEPKPEVADPGKAPDVMPSSETVENHKSETEDEMQRLLNELSASKN